MMPYITPEYYKDEFNGKTFGTSEDLDRELSRASDVVDMITDFKLLSGKFDFEKLDERRKNHVMKATAYLTEFVIAKGGFDEAFSGESNSVNIGSFGYTKGGNSSSANGSNKQGAIIIPNIVYSHLSHAGLLYAGVEVL